MSDQDQAARIARRAEWDTAAARTPMELALARAEAVEEREQLDRDDDAAGRAQAAAFVARMVGRPMLTPDDVVARSAAMPEPPARDYTAAYGSAARPEVLVTVGESWVRLKPREETAQVRRSASEAEREELLARAKAAGDNPFMRRLVAEFDAEHGITRSRTRQAEGAVLERAAARPFADYQTDANGQPITCLWAPAAGGGYEHFPHDSRCLVEGGGYQRA